MDDPSPGRVIFGKSEFPEISLISGRIGGADSGNSGTPVSGLFTREKSEVLCGTLYTLADITHRTTHKAYETA